MDGTAKKIILNSLENAKPGDKAIKLDAIVCNINPGDLVVIASKRNVKRNSFAQKLCKKGGFIFSDRRFFKYKRLKRLAQKENRAVVTYAISKASDAAMTVESLPSKKQIKKYADKIIALNHEPYFYNSGCKHKAKNAEIGWTVLGVSFLK